MLANKTLWLFLVINTAACASKKDANPEKAPTPVVEKPLAKADSPVVLPEKPVLAVAPEYASSTADKKAQAKSRALNVEALALHRAKKHSEAAALFVESLTANPGNVLARYNLACAYNLDGMRNEALATLAQLRLEDCRACAAQVLDAPNDKDWASALDDEKFIALTTGLTIKSPSKKELAKTVVSAFEKKDASLLADYVHPTRVTKFRNINGNCDPRDGSKCDSVEKVYGFDRFAAAMKTLVSTVPTDDSSVEFYTPHGIGTCDDKCCEYTMEHVSHGTLWMSKVCFLDKAGVLFVSEIAATDES